MPKLHGKTLVSKLLQRCFSFFCEVSRVSLPESFSASEKKNSLTPPCFLLSSFPSLASASHHAVFASPHAAFASPSPHAAFASSSPHAAFASPSPNMTKPSRKEKLITAIRTLQNQLAIATAMEEATKLLLSDDSSSDSDSDIEFLEEIAETISKTRYLVPRKKIAKSTAGIDLVLDVSERDSASLSI
jgi:hypothetical protein